MSGSQFFSDVPAINWSPTGAQFAVAPDPSRDGVCLIKVDTAGKACLPIRSLAWSPTGQYIAYMTSTKNYRGDLTIADSGGTWATTLVQGLEDVFELFWR